MIPVHTLPIDMQDALLEAYSKSAVDDADTLKRFVAYDKLRASNLEMATVR